MKLVVWMLVTIVVLLLVGVLPAGDGAPVAVFRSPVIIVLLGAVAVGCLVACLSVLCRRRKGRAFGLKQVGFLLTHISVSLILAGAFLRLLDGEKGSFVVPLMPGHSIINSHGGEVTLDFGVSATDLKIGYYEPDYYNVFARNPGPDSEHASHEFVRRVAIPSDGPLVVDEATSVPRRVMKDHEGRWRPFYALEDGSVLQVSRIVRDYAAILHFKRAGSEAVEAHIAVNHPVTFQKWRFYLMDAKEDQAYIVLSVKRDPGWPLVQSGIWMMMAGVAIMCFRKASAT